MPYSPHSSDEQLIAGCRKKDRLAQKYLYHKYHGRMLHISMRYAGHRAEAADILNRAFMKVFNNLDKYQPTGTLSGWIAKIVFRTAIDYVRQQAVYRQVMDFNTEQEVEINPTILDDLAVEDLYQILQQLPTTSRTVFSLYIVDGYKHREIAELLDININTSKWHLATAKKEMQRLLTAVNFQS